MKKIEYLDGLRGIAALIVVISHYVNLFYPALYTGKISEVHTKSGLEIMFSAIPFNIFARGNFAVYIFFVLSGYVLSYKYFQSKSIDTVIGSAVKRYIRLLIPTSFSIFIAYILLKFSLFNNIKVSALTNPNWFIPSLWNFPADFSNMVEQAFYGVFITGEMNYNIVLWTLKYEFLGSLLIFSFITLFGNLRNRFLIYIIAFLLVIKTYYLPFFLGVILSDIHNSKDVPFKIILSKPIKLFLLLLGMLLGSYPMGRDLNGTIDSTFFKFMHIELAKKPIQYFAVLGAFLIILVVLNSSFMQRILSKKVFIFLGKISFSMYVIHLIIMASFSSYLFLHFAPYFASISPFLTYSIPAFVTFFVSLALIIFLSYFIYKYIDLKGIQFSEYIYQKYFMPDQCMTHKKRL